MKALLQAECAKIDVMLTDEQQEQFLRYYELLIEWNEKMNLTAITDPTEVLQKHFADCLTCLKTGLFSDGATVIDVGTGAGFPAVPLKIACPSLRITALDSLQKRLVFLEEVKRELGLDGITFVHARAEEAGKAKQFREKFDIAVSRAVAPMNVLSEYCLPFVRISGHFLAMKGSKGESEAEEARSAIRTMGGGDLRIYQTEIDNHSLISVQKKTATPSAYPRKAGTPTKKPL